LRFGAISLLSRIMREIVFDTETTGLDPTGGDRLVEIGLIELVNHIPTGRSFHRYVNPERPMSVEALRIHGLDDAFLADKPRFAAVAAELVEFIGDATLIAHNSAFDMGFLNVELGRAGHGAITDDRVIDSLMLARRRHPAGPNSLDALCSRYAIDTSRRTFHGALLDAELLAEVYIELIGGRQAALVLGEEPAAPTLAVVRHIVKVGVRPEPRHFTIAAEDLAAHMSLVETIGEKAIWKAYFAAGMAGAEARSIGA
jgi:DNA polymerase III subunit epsilon